MGDPGESPASNPRVADLASILGHVPAMVGYWDRDLRNVFANEAYSDWFGKSPSQIRGLKAEDLLGPVLYELNRPHFEAVLAGTPQTFQRSLVDVSGRTRFIQTSYSPDVVDGVVVGFFALGTDITRRVEAEAAIRERTEENALLRERQRIEARLHEVVLQHLFAAGLQLDATARHAATVGVASGLGSAVEAIHEAISDLRALVRLDTEPTARNEPDSASLPNTTSPSVVPAITVTGTLSAVSPQAWANMLATLTEALSAGRRAGASRIDVTVSGHRDYLEVRVTDNGQPVTDAQRCPNLINMRSRAEELGGHLTWTVSEDHDTTIVWRVPTADTRDDDQP